MQTHENFDYSTSTTCTRDNENHEHNLCKLCQKSKNKWDLERLFINLAKAKTQYLCSYDNRELTKGEKCCLRLLLQRKNAEQIGKQMSIQTNGITSDYLSRGIYNYIEILFGERPTHWMEVTLMLYEKGYRKNIKVDAYLDQGKNPDITGFNELYISRPKIENEAKAQIQKPGDLLRIKAPQNMGKTWLTRPLLDYAQSLDYQTVIVNFELADSEVFSNYKKFSQWFCITVTQKLGLAQQLAEEDNQEWSSKREREWYRNWEKEYWLDNLTPNTNITNYFEEELLPCLQNPVVLVLEKVDKVFEHREMATNFSQLIRAWTEQAKQGTPQSEIWQQVRFIIVHATDVYAEFGINSSPLANVGLTINLPELFREEVSELAQRYELNLEPEKIDQLIGLVGGHPYLVHQACDYLQKNEVTFEEFLETAPTREGIYCNHLRRLYQILVNNPDLKQAFLTILRIEQSSLLEPVVVFQLESLGLVKLSGNKPEIRCELYRLYFQHYLQN